MQVSFGKLLLLIFFYLIIDITIKNKFRREYLKKAKKAKIVF